MKTVWLAGAFAMVASGAAWAGPQYVDKTGFAVSGYDVVAYFDLPQSDIGQPQPKAVPGRADITAEFNDATFAFATEANRDAFLANPEKYAPQFDGHCAYGVAVGGKVPANPYLWRIVDGALYLNITEDVVGLWEEDISGHITNANTEWKDLEDDRASRKRIPSFTSSAPLVN